MLILGSIRCALAPKFCGEARTHEISKTQNRLMKFHSDCILLKIINIFNEVPKSQLRKIKILIGINENMGEKLLRDEDQV